MITISEGEWSEPLLQAWVAPWGQWITSVLFSSLCIKEQYLYWSVNTSTNLACWTRRIWSNFSWSKYTAALPLYLDFSLIEWQFSHTTVQLLFLSPLPSLAAEIRDELHWDVFANVIILHGRPERFSVYFKLRNTWLPLWVFCEHRIQHYLHSIIYGIFMAHHSGLHKVDRVTL